MNLFGLTRPQLQSELAPLLAKKYQIESVYQGLYLRLIRDFAALTDLSKRSREELAEKYEIRWPSLDANYLSSDGTVRFLLKLDDGKTVEGVYIPEGERVTFCLSSQVGCALACSFCMTGKLGFTRNLTTGEILGALFAMRYEMRDAMIIPNPQSQTPYPLPFTPNPRKSADLSVGPAAGPPLIEKPFNIVFMGQGEPFLNRKNLWAALDILTDPDGAKISWRRITVSTAGVLDGIREWARIERRPRLALSLTTAINVQRSELMPVNETFPIDEIAEFLRDGVEWRSNERMFFEFPLLSGINTSPRHANALAKLAQGIPCKINLIPWNPAPELDLQRPSDTEVQEFQDRLIHKGFTTTVRKSKGVDIFGACGQLHALHSADKSKTANPSSGK